MTSRCIGRKTEARGGNGEIPAAALGDGMMGGGTPEYFDYFDDDDFDDGDFDDGVLVILMLMISMTMMMILTWNNHCQGCVRMSRGRGRQHC